MNIETVENVTKITPLQSSFNDVSPESIEHCINIAKFNAMNKMLFNNCCNASCAICNNSVSKCISNGSYNASTMFVDAFPSEYESYTGAFTDEKGYLLEEALKGTKFSRSDIYCTTLIKCFNIHDTNEGIINNCLLNYFYKELDLIKPKRIIFTYSAFQASLKYKVIPYTGNINYFTKVHTHFQSISLHTAVETDIFIVYDIKALTEQQREAFKQGIQFILQQ